MSRIAYLIMDVDGTLTDGKIYMGNAGEFCKVFNVKDGYGIRDIIIPRNIIPIIITGRESEIVTNRCKELGIKEVYQGIAHKIDKLRELKIDLSRTAYVGDDINDVSCMLEIKKNGGLVGCPFDAVNEVKEITDFMSVHKGGDGAVRDFIEWMLNNSMY